jgi:dihydroorotase
MIGFETAVPLVIMELVNRQKMSWLDVITKMTVNPARILKISAGSINPGTAANITMIAPDRKWKVTAEKIRSRSKNTPLLGTELKGRVKNVILKGVLKYSLKD